MICSRWNLATPLARARTLLHTYYSLGIWGDNAQYLEEAEGEGAFDENDVSVLTAAFDATWQAVLKAGASFANGEAEATRELLALRIIKIARSGVWDQHRLRDDALLYLTQSTAKSSGC